MGRFNAELGLFKNDDVGTWYAASELLECQRRLLESRQDEMPFYGEEQSESNTQSATDKGERGLHSEPQWSAWFKDCKSV